MGVTVKTGWRMFHQIGKVLADDEASSTVARKPRM